MVPWNDWGPGGTHIAHFDARDTCRFSAMGCSCAVTQRRSSDASGNAFLKVLVFDVHPWVARSDSDSEQRSRFLQLAGADTRSGLGFTQSVRTTFPFDVARRDIPFARDERSPTVVLIDDGLLLVMCRSLTELIKGDVYIQTKIELARSGRIDGTPSAAVTVADRLASLRERRARFHAGDHPLKRVRGRPFGSLGALSYNGFLTMISEGMVHLWRPPAAFSSIGEQKIARSVRELQLEGFNTSSCATDVAQDLLVVSRKDPAAIKGRPHPNASQSRISLSLASEGWQSDY
ncbi:hypothetical protein V8D89_003208, partial [Ganoderma adspersum]